MSRYVPLPRFIIPDADGVQIGTRVTLVLKDVPREVVASRNPRLALIVHGLLQHEHKQTVLHFAVQRNTEFTEPVRAKVSRLLIGNGIETRC